MSYQQIIIEGRITSDIDMRYTPDGVPVATFSMAHNTRRKGEDYTVWHRITVWRKDAENAAQYLAKGREVLVVGEVEAHAFTGKDGQVRASLEVNAHRVSYVGSRQEYEAGQDLAGVSVDTADSIPF